MVSKAQRVKLWWEWERSSGRTYYLWRYVIENGIGRGSFLYLFQQVCHSLFDWHLGSNFSGDWKDIVVWLLVSAFLNYLLGLLMWEHHEQKYRDSISKAQNADGFSNDLPNPANPV